MVIADLAIRVIVTLVVTTVCGIFLPLISSLIIGTISGLGVSFILDFHQLKRTKSRIVELASKGGQTDFSQIVEGLKYNDATVHSACSEAVCRLLPEIVHSGAPVTLDERAILWNELYGDNAALVSVLLSVLPSIGDENALEHLKSILEWRHQNPDEDRGSNLAQFDTSALQRAYDLLALRIEKDNQKRLLVRPSLSSESMEHRLLRPAGTSKPDSGNVYLRSSVDNKDRTENVDVMEANSSRQAVDDTLPGE
jgi:hypothetical protein